ncbi:MAG: T9SS type A sorting domain-containing protein, partial [Sphingobacteriaceae bacterium]
LIGFVGKIEGSHVKLNWKTGSELNNKGYVVYRSSDDKQAIKIGEVAGNGNSSSINNYSFTDKAPFTGNNYYKLVQVDFDGKETDLGDKVVSFDFSGAAIEVSPNPTEGKVTVRFNSGNYQVLTVAGLDGKVLQTLKLQPIDSSIELNLMGYTKGIYFIKLL